MSSLIGGKPKKTSKKGSKSKAPTKSKASSKSKTSKKSSKKSMSRPRSRGKNNKHRELTEDLDNLNREELIDRMNLAVDYEDYDAVRTIQSHYYSEYNSFAKFEDEDEDEDAKEYGSKKGNKKRKYRK